jgi:hypothetical protein
MARSQRFDVGVIERPTGVQRRQNVKLRRAKPRPA